MYFNRDLKNLKRSFFRKKPRKQATKHHDMPGPAPAMLRKQAV